MSLLIFIGLGFGLAQAFAIVIHAYSLWCEKKYCSHCYWWSNIGAIFFFVLSFVPFLGLFTSIAGCGDYMRNVTKELTKDNKYEYTFKVE